MKEILFRVSLIGICLSFFGCSNGDNAGDEVTQIQQYIKTTLKPKLQTIEDQIDTMESGSPLSSDGSSSVSEQRLTLMEDQLTQALETIQGQTDRIFELEKQLASMRGEEMPVRSTFRSSAASTVSPVSPVSPTPVPRVESAGSTSVNDAYFDSLVVQQYRQTYTSSTSLSNYQITLFLGKHFEAQGTMDQYIQMDPTFEEKYRQAKILSGRN